MHDALEVINSDKLVRDVALCGEASGDYKVFGFGNTAVGGLDSPLALVGVELGVDYDTVEGGFLLDAEDLVAVVKVGPQVLVVGVVVGPDPIFVCFWDGELVLWDLGVYTSTWVAVPPPSATKIL